MNKAFHANLIFKRWKFKTWKFVNSTCTGTSYSTRYITKQPKDSANIPRFYIYHKLMKDFKFQPSPNTKVAKRQTARFERNCHRVLSKEVIKPGGTSNIASKLGAAKASNFLFLKSQKINRKVQHLKYKHIKPSSDGSCCSFSTPSDVLNLKTQKQATIVARPENIKTTPVVEATVVARPENIQIPPVVVDKPVVHTVEPFRPLPKFRVPENYQDIVPPDPIYDKKECFQRNEIVEHTPSDGDKFHKSKQEKDAKYHGMSIKHFLRRRRQTHGPQQDSKGKSAIFEDYLSSDTIAIESCPLKRWVDINPNLSVLMNTPKRSHQVTHTTIDSEQAGPSKVDQN
ncbi:hypothetical protein C1646_760815 [Rhizophagus diaphanus]|nr:hypothetical protein C1646_760815 [Rhizophagus diaphanus] [Rhizophagus sp. MUCL 43196]